VTCQCNSGAAASRVGTEAADVIRVEFADEDPIEPGHLLCLVSSERPMKSVRQSLDGWETKKLT
jgi:hypothetical protein